MLMKSNEVAIDEIMLCIGPRVSGIEWPKGRYVPGKPQVLLDWVSRRGYLLVEITSIGDVQYRRYRMSSRQERIDRQTLTYLRDALR